MDRIYDSPFRVPFPLQFGQRQQKRENNRKILDFQGFCRSFGLSEEYRSIRKNLFGRDVFLNHAKRPDGKARRKTLQRAFPEQNLRRDCDGWNQCLSRRLRKSKAFAGKNSQVIRRTLEKRLRADP